VTKIFFSVGFLMSDQLKLSKLFYINPTLLPSPFPPPPSQRHRRYLRPKYYATGPSPPPLPRCLVRYPWAILKNSIFTNGFDSKYPIIVGLEIDSEESNKHQTLMMLNKVLLEFPRFPSATSIDRLDVTDIADGSHRLVVALELKLDHVPVRFQYLKQADD
jgi:hypothetical protein